MDNKLLEKLMAKKSNQEPLDPNYKDAKMSMLEALLHEMHGMMGNDLKDVKKVEVAAPDKDGLAAGLDQAKDLVAGDASAGDESKDEDGDNDFEESIADHDENSPESSEEHDPYAGLSDDELKQHLELLQAKLGRKI